MKWLLTGLMGLGRGKGRARKVERVKVRKVSGKKGKAKTHNGAVGRPNRF